MRIEYLRNRIKELEHQIVKSYKQLAADIAQSLKDKIQEQIYELRMELKNAKSELRMLCLKDELQQLNCLRSNLLVSKTLDAASERKANELIKSYDENIYHVRKEIENA